MKPDAALSSSSAAGASGGDMEDGEAAVDPAELFSALGVLVVESRVPEQSPKGRTQGPHCPRSVTRPSPHICDTTRIVCQRQAVLQQQVALLWKNRVPMCIEVLLLPDCEHGQQRAQSVDVGQPADEGRAVLLEQWTINAVTRRAYASAGVPASALFQAVKSYLYFSQLSSWYNMTHGHGPVNVAYRISPPGEFCTSHFHETPLYHTFPISTSPGKSSAIKVSVGSLPRRQLLLHLPCPELHVNKAAEASKSSPPHLLQNPPEQRQQQQQQPAFKDGLLPYSKPRVSRPVPPSQLPVPPPPIPQLRQPLTPQGDMYTSCRSGAIPKSPACRTSSSTHHRPHSDTANSPKVLVTSKSLGRQLYYDKQQPPPPQTDSDNSSPELDRLLNRTLGGGAAPQLQPLSPQEMETYLASLYPRPRRLFPPQSPPPDTLPAPLRKSPERTAEEMINSQVNFVIGDNDDFQQLTSCAELITTPTKPPHRANSLIRTVMRRELVQQSHMDGSKKDIPTEADANKFREAFTKSAHMLFHCKTGLPLQSSPAPIKKRTSLSFDYDDSLISVRAIQNSISCVNLDEKRDTQKEDDGQKSSRFYSTSAPASTNSLLGNFEESILNGRIEPSGVVDGFTAELGASGSFCPKHVTLPVTSFFFSLSEDNAPSPYLGHINLDIVGKRGYHVPKKGTVQVTLFNPNKTVVKMFVVMYDLEDMPNNCQTFLRQRTLYMPVSGTPCDTANAPTYLRYLIHLRFCSSRSGKIYLHTDLRLIFARDKFEYDSRVANYELRSFTEGPVNPKYSPKR